MSPWHVAEIQKHFHQVIMNRVAELIRESDVPLPQLTDAPRGEEAAAWFPVPGMYGGFRYWLEGDGESLKLVTESWSRVEDGSGQRHEITPAGATLIDEGFV